MTTERTPAAPSHPEIRRRWAAPTILSVLVLVPIGILVFSNLSTETVSWLGFEMTAPLWLILLLTFVGGMVGGKVFGWAWRRSRRKRKQMKEELAVLRKHAAESEKAAEKAARDAPDED